MCLRSEEKKSSQLGHTLVMRTPSSKEMAPAKARAVYSPSERPIAMFAASMASAPPSDARSFSSTASSSNGDAGPAAMGGLGSRTPMHDTMRKGEELAGAERLGDDCLPWNVTRDGVALSVGVGSAVLRTGTVCHWNHVDTTTVESVFRITGSPQCECGNAWNVPSAGQNQKWW